MTMTKTTMPQTTVPASSKLTGIAHRGIVRALMLGALGCAAQQGQAEAQAMRSTAGNYEVEILVDGASAPTYAHRGETYILGSMGARYTLRVSNRTARRIEAVVSVDGRDVVDGKPADTNKRGYLVPAWGSVDIDGWRLSARQAAAFRFSSVPESYAGRMGNARNVGVIGVGIFPERYVPRPRPIVPYYPYSSRGGGFDDGYQGQGARRDEAPKSAAPAAAPSAGASADHLTEGESLGGLASAAPERRAKSAQRPGLGTEFGEAVDSNIREVSFVRQSAHAPAFVLGFRYNDRAGLLALGIDVDGWNMADDSHLRGSARPFPVSHGFAAPPVGWRR